MAITPIATISDRVIRGAKPSLLTPISDVKTPFPLAPFFMYLLLLAGLCSL